MNSAEFETRNHAGSWPLLQIPALVGRRLNMLMDGEEPAGGQWSFDEDNRKKVPKAMLSEIPELPAVDFGEIEADARKYDTEVKIHPVAGHPDERAQPPLVPHHPRTRSSGCGGSSTNRSTCLAPTIMPSSRTKTGCGTAWATLLPSTSALLHKTRVRGGRSHRLRREEQRPPELWKASFVKSSGLMGIPHAGDLRRPGP